MGLHKIILPSKRLALAGILLTSIFSTQGQAAPANSLDTFDLSLAKGKSASRLEIISSVKKKHPGRILSIRKKYKTHDNDCHHVKMIAINGEIITVRVNCK